MQRHAQTLRIRIEDLPPIENLTADEIAALFGAGIPRTRLGLESLELREMPATGFALPTLESRVLTIQGTASGDQIMIGQTSTAINVYDGTSLKASFPKANVDSIFVGGLGGDDVIDLRGPTSGQTVTLPTSLSGGDGNDKLYGGSGNDQLLGGAGNDYFSGLAGANTTADLTGGDVVVVGGVGDVTVVGKTVELGGSKFFMGNTTQGTHVYRYDVAAGTFGRAYANTVQSIAVSGDTLLIVPSSATSSFVVSQKADGSDRQELQFKRLGDAVFFLRDMEGGRYLSYFDTVAGKVGRISSTYQVESFTVADGLVWAAIAGENRVFSQTGTVTETRVYHTHERLGDNVYFLRDMEGGRYLSYFDTVAGKVGRISAQFQVEAFAVERGLVWAAIDGENRVFVQEGRNTDSRVYHETERLDGTEYFLHNYDGGRYLWFFDKAGRDVGRISDQFQVEAFAVERDLVWAAIDGENRVFVQAGTDFSTRVYHETERLGGTEYFLHNYDGGRYLWFFDKAGRDVGRISDQFQVEAFAVERDLVWAAIDGENRVFVQVGTDFSTRVYRETERLGGTEFFLHNYEGGSYLWFFDKAGRDVGRISEAHQVSDFTVADGLVWAVRQDNGSVFCQKGTDSDSRVHHEFKELGDTVYFLRESGAQQHLWYYDTGSGAVCKISTQHEVTAFTVADGLLWAVRKDGQGVFSQDGTDPDSRVTHAFEEFGGVAYFLRDGYVYGLNAGAGTVGKAYANAVSEFAVIGDDLWVVRSNSDKPYVVSLDLSGTNKGTSEDYRFQRIGDSAYFLKDGAVYALNVATGTVAKATTLVSNGFTIGDTNLMRRYLAEGGPSGSLGLPTSNGKPFGQSWWGHTFQHGTIMVKGTDTLVVQKGQSQVGLSLFDGGNFVSSAGVGFDVFTATGNGGAGAAAGVAVVGGIIEMVVSMGMGYGTGGGGVGMPVGVVAIDADGIVSGVSEVSPEIQLAADSGDEWNPPTGVGVIVLAEEPTP